MHMNSVRAGPIPTAELGTILSLLLLRGEVHIPVEWVLILRIL